MIANNMMLREVPDLSDEDRMLIGQAVTQHGDGVYAAPNVRSIAFVHVDYVCECLVRAREAGAGYPAKLAALGGRLRMAINSRPRG